MKLKTNKRRIIGKFRNMWKLHNTILEKGGGVKKEIKGEIRKYLETNKNENPTYQIYGIQQKQYQEGSL